MPSPTPEGVPAWQPWTGLAVVLAAERMNRIFPMMMTPSGTIHPARVVILGAGVAGLQAIATAKRLGAMVEGYDVRGATKEQVQSLGAKFVDTGVSAEGAGGYARELTEEEKQQQAEVLANHIAAADAVITTAAVPGRPAPWPERLPGWLPTRGLPVRQPPGWNRPVRAPVSAPGADRQRCA